ncbi:hypothetical protein OSB04_031528 [Centaurea solstitialis]|uniref:CCHC-type domain-containing protein n=1 Tax=Centaurea solstitialis TaxID=347529 RepID=A0AA38SMB8_9ASTR|nr:hypothetical protein OSB04_031528 [Centaurea solstitialis]
MASTVTSTNNLSLRSILEKDKLTGPNFLDWERNLMIVLRHERKWYVLEEPLGEAPPANAPAAARNAHKKHSDDLLDVACLMLATMSPDLQAGLINTNAYDMIRQLRDMFQTQARTERYDATKAFNECKMVRGTSVSDHVMKMKRHLDHLERLGHPVPLQLATDTILNSLSEDYRPFVVNYNMNNMEKTIAELHSMLKIAELNMGNKNKTKDVLMVKDGGVKKKNGQASTSKGKGPVQAIQSAPKKGKGKGKGKKVKPNKARTENRCFICNEIGHWRQNCPKRHEAGRNHSSTQQLRKVAVFHIQELEVSPGSYDQLLNNSYKCCRLKVAQIFDRVANIGRDPRLRLLLGNSHRVAIKGVTRFSGSRGVKGSLTRETFAGRSLVDLFSSNQFEQEIVVTEPPQKLISVVTEPLQEVAPVVAELPQEVFPVVPEPPQPLSEEGKVSVVPMTKILDYMKPIPGFPSDFAFVVLLSAVLGFWSDLCRFAVGSIRVLFFLLFCSPWSPFAALSPSLDQCTSLQSEFELCFSHRFRSRGLQFDSDYAVESGFFVLVWFACCPIELVGSLGYSLLYGRFVWFRVCMVSPNSCGMTSEQVSKYATSEVAVEDTHGGDGSRKSVFQRLSLDPRLRFDQNNAEKSFADVVGVNAGKDMQLEFFLLEDKTKKLVKIPLDLAKRASCAFKATICGYFLGPRLQFEVVKRFAKTHWGKYGFIDVMLNAHGFFFFKFETEGGASQVADLGSVMLNGVPFFVMPWDPTKGLVKPQHSSCPLWVKIHNIPLVAFNREGISRIASALGVPKLMDACTTTMCDKAWGRPGFAKVLIDVWAVGELKRELEIIIPSLSGNEEHKVVLKVEYLWEPVQCSHCLVFGHKLASCAKAVAVGLHKSKGKESQIDDDGFQKVTKNKWIPKSVRSTNGASTSHTGIDTDSSILEGTLEPEKSSDVEPSCVDVNTLGRVEEVEIIGSTLIDHTVVEEAAVETSMVDVSTGVKDNSGSGGKENSMKGNSPSAPPVIEKVVNAMASKPLKSCLKTSNRFVALKTDDMVRPSKNQKGLSLSSPRVEESNTKKGGSASSLPKAKQAEVRELIKEHGVSVCAVVESRVLDVNIGTVCSSVFPNWSWMSNVAYADTGARLIVAWDSRCLDLVLLEAHAQYLHCQVHLKSTQSLFYATFVYGANTAIERRQLWSGLRKAKVLLGSHPWTLLGDFNVMLFPHDGYGGSSRRSVDMEEFFLCLEDTEVMDIQYSGVQYTWCQKPSGGEGLNRKLDRIMSNVEFTSMFMEVAVHFLPRGISDHSPGILSFGIGNRKFSKGFRFENFVTENQNFMNVVDMVWKTPVYGSFMHKVLCRLKLLKKPLRQLRSSYGDVSKRVKKLKVELDEKQGRRFIDSVCDRNGSVVMGDAVATTFLDHFQEILGTSDDLVVPVIPLGLFSAKLQLTEALDIIRPITDKEIRDSIFAIGNDKAPGSDGFTSKFFKSAWGIVGRDVTIAVHNFFYSGRLLKELNHTMISLIPKVPNPSRVGDYRPISCCTVLYKCISKLISDRMKGYLDGLISRNQSAFIPGRRISDNILMAHQLVSGYHKHSGPPRCAFKIDIRKAYDMVNWEYIIIMLQGFGFHPVFVKWIKEMLSTTSFSIGINGDSVGFFKGERGLRQGDPISPYLFTIVMEGFTMAMKQCIAQASSSFRFHDGCDQLDITHLSFADDLFVFTRGDLQSVEVLKRALELFGGWSGLEPSLEKSQVFFANVTPDIQHAILHTLPFAPGTFPIRYLGVHLSPVRLKVADFSGLVTKIKLRIHNWKSKSLSFAGSRQLIISVLQSLQLFWMGVFLFPSGVVHEIEGLFRSFLWAQGESVQGKCRLAWEMVCRPIECGGLGIRRLNEWNRALLAKHV